MPQKNYLARSFSVCLLVIALLVICMHVPGTQVGNLRLKRVNILSDLVALDDKPLAATPHAYVPADTGLLAAEFPSVPDTAGPLPEVPTIVWTVEPAQEETTGQHNVLLLPQQEMLRQKIAAYQTGGTVRIEDFGACGGPLEQFGRKLYRSCDEPVHIAVLGDSFVEGDILTADLRDEMQRIFTGRGPGFLAFHNPIPNLARSADCYASGWESYNLVQRREAPERLGERFALNGTISIPTDSAYCRLSPAPGNGRPARYSTARILFANRQHSIIQIALDGQTRKDFVPPSDEGLQQVLVQGDLGQLRIRIRQPEGFIGYGVVLEDPTGVGVDNFALRGNTGVALLGTNAALNRSLQAVRRYDLVILQYGLNAMSPDITDYAFYTRQLERTIAYVRACFPQSALLVMSVGDRSTRSEGAFVTMPAIRPLVAAQREAALRTGAAFWNTFEAMGGENSMPRYVERGWAAKDYTHLSRQGGKQIARQLAGSLVQYCRRFDAVAADTTKTVSGYSLPVYPKQAGR